MKNNEKCVKEASKKEAKPLKRNQCTGKKFVKFTRYLEALTEDSIDLTFSDIERILEKDLATSHKEYKEDWANTFTNSLGCSWMNAGFRISNVDMENERATFTRTNSLKEN